MFYKMLMLVTVSKYPILFPTVRSSIFLLGISLVTVSLMLLLYALFFRTGCTYTQFFSPSSSPIYFKTNFFIVITYIITLEQIIQTKYSYINVYYAIKHLKVFYQPTTFIIIQYNIFNLHIFFFCQLFNLFKLSILRELFIPCCTMKILRINKRIVQIRKNISKYTTLR